MAGTDPYLPHRPVPAKPIVKTYPTPNLSDRIYVVRKDSRAAGYELPEKGAAYDGVEAEKFKGFVFATAQPSDQTGWVDHFYLNAPANEDAYNGVIEYPWVSADYPRATRTYVVLRSDYEEPKAGVKDSQYPDLVLVDYKRTRLDDPVKDALFVGVTKTFERVPAPTEYVVDRPEHAIPFKFRVAVPTHQVEEVQEGPAQDPGAIVEGTWHHEEHTTSAFRRIVQRIVRVLGNGVTLIGKKLTKDQQLATVTESWLPGDQTITPRATLIEADVEQIGDGSTVKTEVEVDSVFPESAFEITIPDLIPEEFRGLAPARTTEQTLAGTAAPPALGTGELKRGERQTTEFIKRTDVTARDLTDLPKTLTNQKLTSEFGGGALNIDRTLAATSLGLDQGLAVVESEVKELGAGLRIKETAVLTGGLPELLLTDGGSGFTGPPAVSFTGGTGSGAVAVATIAKPVDHLTMTNNGSDYLWRPAVVFTGDGGGTVGVAVMASEVSRVDVTDGGEGYTSPPTVVFDTSFGTGAAATAIIGKAVVSLTVTSNGSGYDRMPAVLITGDGSGASAEAVLGYPLDVINLTNAGSGYTSLPTVIISGGGGAGAAATVTTSSVLASINVTTPGLYDFSTTPNVSFSGGGGTGATAVAVMGTSVLGVIINYSGSGYTSLPTVAFVGGGGTGATGVARRGIASSITVTNGGSGYIIGDILTVVGGTFDQPAQLHVTGVSGGVITSVVWEQRGQYSVVPSTPVSVTGGSGSGATFTPSFSVINGVIITAGGTGYTSAPTITFTGGGSSDPPTIVAARGIASVTLTSAGIGYTSAPTVSFDFGGGAAATAIMSVVLTGITITNPGNAYTSPPTISFSGGGGTGAAATAIVHTGVTSLGAVSRLNLISGGSGYTTPPTISFFAFVTGDPGSGAAATAALGSDGSVVGFTITNPGTGYTAPPFIALTGGGGTGALAVAELTGAGTVVGVSITHPGAWRSAPVVSFEGGEGSGASATAVLASTGFVDEVTLTNTGAYTVAPTVVFTGGGGSGAAALYIIPNVQWPKLYETHTDPELGIVVNDIKQVVAAGTRYPGSGFVEIHGLDKWRSIQIVSAVDVRTLPKPEIFPEAHELNLPPTLLEVSARWNYLEGTSALAENGADAYNAETNGGFARAFVKVEATINGEILIKMLDGFSGRISATVTRTYYFGRPLLANLPPPTLIQAALGTAVLFGSHAEATQTYGSGVGANSQLGQTTSTVTHIPACLTGGFLTTNALSASVIGGPQGATATDLDGHTYHAFLAVAGQPGQLVVAIPLSTPYAIPSGTVLNLPCRVARWRFNVWIVESIVCRVP